VEEKRARKRKAVEEIDEADAVADSGSAQKPKSKKKRKDKGAAEE